jgi:Xaa-Pro aminopeptidase
MDYPARQMRLAAELRSAHIDAVLVTHMANIRYLCGFSGSAGMLLVHGGRVLKLTFFTDGRYTQQAAEEVKGARVVICRQPIVVEACEGVRRSRTKLLGFEAEHLPYSSYQQLRQLLRGKARLKPLVGLVERLRLIKDSDEIQNIRRAVILGANLLPAALSVIKPGIKETEIAAELELQARRSGAEGMSFETIVAAGARSALPHGRASSQPIPASGFIILDYGVILAGYCSDMTRTVHVGPVPPKRRRMYEAVREAQLASIEAVRPGIAAGEVDRAGRELLKKAGYDTYFTHSTGHGVGIEIHEGPRIAKGQVEKLAPGMVITIEPGIYIPDDGGVRIEDMVLVTASGHEVLTPAAKDLVAL